VPHLPCVPATKAERDQGDSNVFETIIIFAILGVFAGPLAGLAFTRS